MGEYLEVPQRQGKAEHLVTEHGASSVTEDAVVDTGFVGLDNAGHALVCVVENESWDAAGVAPDQNELNRFRIRPGEDERPRTWLLMDPEKVRRMLARGNCGCKTT